MERSRELSLIVLLEVTLAPAVAHFGAKGANVDDVFWAAWGGLGLLGAGFAFRRELRRFLACRKVRVGKDAPSLVDLSESITALEAAMRCATDPREVQAWLDRLTTSYTFPFDEIDEATALPVDQWLTITHGICRESGQPLPSFFQQAFDQNLPEPASDEDAAAFDAAPGSGVLAVRMLRAAQSVEDADRIFERHRHAETRTNVIDVYKAYGQALENHGARRRAGKAWGTAGGMEAGGREEDGLL